MKQSSFQPWSYKNGISFSGAMIRNYFLKTFLQPLQMASLYVEWINYKQVHVIACNILRPLKFIL